MLLGGLEQQTEEWLSWKVVQQFDASSKNVVASLLQWREEVAQRKNKPSNYILPRNIVVDLARRKPQTIHELRRNRRINHGLIKNHGLEILQCISQGRRSKQTWPPIQYSDLTRKQLLLAWGQCFAETCGVAADLIMPPTLAQQIAQHGMEELRGWRRRMLHDALSAFLSGTTTLGFQNEKAHIHVQ